MTPGAVFISPGLHRDTGAWAICVGAINPVIYIDPQCPTNSGYNALVTHEVYHARMRHKLKEMFLWVLWPTVIGLGLWALYRRRMERTADFEALRVFGDKEYRAFLAMHKSPSSWWGRWKYGATIEQRYKRATGRDW